MSKYFPFPITRNSILQSVIPLSPQRMKVDWFTADFSYEAFLNSKFNRSFKDTSFEFLMYEPNGGWEFARPHLARFAFPMPKEYTLQKITNIVYEYSLDWQLPFFNIIPSGSEINMQYVNPDSFSGFWTSHFFGIKKRDAVNPSNVLAKNLYNMIKSRLVVNTSLQTCGGREKIAKYSDLGEVTSSRVVIQEETPITQIKQVFS